jgi:hypothetical protein
MSDCCSNTPAKTALPCPQCGELCKHVTVRTLYHQVRFPENSTISASAVHCFCTDKHCSVGYFSDAGSVIPKEHLTTFQDIQNDKLCYCFDIEADRYLIALRAGDAGSIKDFVVQRTQSGECACDVRNPSGQCCLAKFKYLEQ